jgi:hypothetical protein
MADDALRRSKQRKVNLFISILKIFILQTENPLRFRPADGRAVCKRYCVTVALKTDVVVAAPCLILSPPLLL